MVVSGWKLAIFNNQFMKIQQISHCCFCPLIWCLVLDGAQLSKVMQAAKPSTVLRALKDPFTQINSYIVYLTYLKREVRKMKVETLNEHIILKLMN